MFLLLPLLYCIQLNCLVFHKSTVMCIWNCWTIKGRLFFNISLFFQLQPNRKQLRIKVPCNSQLTVCLSICLRFTLINFVLFTVFKMLFFSNSIVKNYSNAQKQKIITKIKNKRSSFWLLKLCWRHLHGTKFRAADIQVSLVGLVK